MTERERVLAVLDGQTPDVTPWFGDLSYWYTAMKTRGDLDPGYEGDEGYLRLHRDTGVGIYLYAPGLWEVTTGDAVVYESHKEGDLTVSTYTTPEGRVRSATKYLPESFTSAYVEHYVKGPGDLKVMRRIFRERRFKPTFDRFRAIDALWGESGLPAALAPCSVSPLQTLIARWAGLEATVDLLMDAPDELEQTLHELEALDDPIFEILCDAPCRLVCFPENLSGEVTGRSLMAQYEIPYWQRRIEQLHAAGKSVCLHNDGTLRASLPLLVETDLDVIEAVTPAPVGDLSVAEIRDVTRGKAIVWGCLPGALFSPLYSDAFFDDYVRTVLDTFPSRSGFVLGVADQVPPDATFARVARVRELVG